MICDECREEFGAEGGIEVDGRKLHARCFRCAECAKPIGTEGYVPKEGRYFHPNCVPKAASGPTKSCARCQKPLEGAVLQAMGKDWHDGCFTCKGCSAALKGKFIAVSGQPYCSSKCAPAEASAKCHTCREPLTDSIEVEGKFFHQKGCFRCHACHKDIESQYVRHEDDFYHKECSPNSCICEGCKQVILDDHVVIGEERRHFHKRCYKCSTCSTLLGNSVVELGHRFYCSEKCAQSIRFG